MSNGRGAVFAVAALVVIVAAGCAPPQDAGPPAGCYDSTRFADHYYSGVPNVRDNMDFWSSTDGSCTDPVGADVGSSTLVLAPDERSASQRCAELGLAGTIGRWRDSGYTAMPAEAWICPNAIVVK